MRSLTNYLRDCRYLSQNYLRKIGTVAREQVLLVDEEKKNGNYFKSGFANLSEISFKHTRNSIRKFIQIHSNTNPESSASILGRD